MLNIKKTIENNKAIYALEGRLDTVTSPDLEKELKDTLTEITELVFDFKGLEYISSAGLRVLLSAQKTMAKQRKSQDTKKQERLLLPAFCFAEC